MVELEYLKDNLNTFEVKEVDLEKEMESFFIKMQVQENENIFEDTFKNIARHFAAWQKEQDKQWLTENHKHIFAKGRDSMKQQMIKEAVEARFTLFDGFCIDRELYKNYKVGGKYKLLVIKED